MEKLVSLGIRNEMRQDPRNQVDEYNAEKEYGLHNYLTSDRKQAGNGLDWAVTSPRA